MKIEEFKEFLFWELDKLVDITGMYFECANIHYKRAAGTILHTLRLKSDLELQFESELNIPDAIASLATVIAIRHTLDNDYLYDVCSILYEDRSKAQKFVIQIVDKFDEIYSECQDLDKSINELYKFYKTKEY